MAGGTEGAGDGLVEGNHVDGLDVVALAVAHQLLLNDAVHRLDLYIVGKSGQELLPDDCQTRARLQRQPGQVSTREVLHARRQHADTIPNGFKFESDACREASTLESSMTAVICSFLMPKPTGTSLAVPHSRPSFWMARTSSSITFRSVS